MLFGLPCLMIPWIDPDALPDLAFPPPEQALEAPNGLLAAGGDLSSERLLAAYRQGIFPWFSEGQPVLWWSPDPRMVLWPAAFRLHRSLLQALKRPDYQVRLDSDFAAVLHACASIPRAGQPGTWITPAMQHAYLDLHQSGFAHSVEIWRQGSLIGGLYGVAIGAMFYGESMFSRQRDASKLAFAHLARFWQQQTAHCGLIDCQMHTAHLASLGATTCSRAVFLEQVQTLTALSGIGAGQPGRWPETGAGEAACGPWQRQAFADAVPGTPDMSGNTSG